MLSAYDYIELLTEPPRISISPSNLDLAPGNTAFLSCVPNGFPQPWTTWFRTNIFGARSQLPSLGDTFTKFSNGLQLHDVSRDDSGTYECRVENRLGSTEQQALVRVEGEANMYDRNSLINKIVAIFSLIVQHHLSLWIPHL